MFEPGAKLSLQLGGLNAASAVPDTDIEQSVNVINHAACSYDAILFP
jgi:hypothetical protein